MSLVPGARVGCYEIGAQIGAGGMGEVYRALDTDLGRHVAIKVLPDSFHNDADRLARFEREARALASLNHPNVAQIYGLEMIDGARGLVMELVEGETLATRIAKGRVPLTEAVSIARQIAEGLEAAHDKGIVHRDIKPANINVTPGGVVKILDFGLAKAVAPTLDTGATSAITIAHDGTREGAVIGTAAYMSPEQARGKAVDERTDIWAFGCVLYELVAGRPAFGRDTITDTLAAILEREPAWEALPDPTPPAVRRVLRRCLEKDLRRRLRDIGDARLELEDAVTGETVGDRAPMRPASITRRTVIGTLVTAAAGAAAGTLAVSRYRADATPRALGRFAIPLPDTGVATASFNKRVAISPNGAYLACNTVPRGNGPNIFIRSMRELDLKPLTDSARGTPFFSHDSRSVGYFSLEAPWRLRTVGLGGGAPVNVCDLENFSGASWADDDTIYFVPAVPGGLSRVPAAGGQPVSVVSLDLDRGERLYKFPYVLPGSAAVLLTVGTVDTESFDDAQIVVVSLRTGEKRVLIEGGTGPCFSPSGHIVYARGGALFAIPFDLGSLKVTGESSMVLDGVLMSRNSGVANFDLSATGDLVYMPGRAVGGVRTLHWVDRSGRAEPLPLPPRSYLHPRLSPDASRLAVEVEGSDHDVYVYDFTRGVLSNLTADGVSHWPVWSPDGTRIGYRSGPMGQFRLFEVPADRSGAARQVLGAAISQSPGSYSPDGRAMVLTMNVNTAAQPKVAIVPLEGDPTPRPLDDSRYAQGSPKFSPDGRYLAYCSNEAGRPQVYVQAFPGPGPKLQVSADGGTDPVWRRDGRELFYRNGDSMMVVPVSGESTLRPGRPEQLWTGSYSHGMSSSCGAPGLTSSNYDVTADGQRFLMVKDDDVEQEAAREMVLVQGWAGEWSRALRT